jgi:hypothetical protein
MMQRGVVGGGEKRTTSRTRNSGSPSHRRAQQSLAFQENDTASALDDHQAPEWASDFGCYPGILMLEIDMLR